MNAIIPNKAKSVYSENSEKNLPSSTQQAIFDTIHNTPGIPPKQIAGSLDISYKHLLNSCNPNQPFKFSSRHLLPLMQVTKNYQILKFLAYKTNYFIFKVPDKRHRSAGGALSIYFRIGKEQERLLVLLNQYFAQNGTEDPDSMERIDGVIWELINNLAELRAAIKNKPTNKKGDRNGK